MADKFEVEMSFEKTTKRTYRFFEFGSMPKIGTLYVQQSAFKSQPKKLKVTVEVLE